MILTTELIADVAGNIRINNNTVDVARWQVLNNLNAAVRLILNNAPVSALSEAVRTVRADFKKDYSDYQWPTDWVRFVKVWVRYSAYQRFTECTPQEDDSVESPVSLDRMPTDQFPKVGLNLERGYRLMPKPTADVTKGIRLRYVYQLPTMTATTQDCMLDVKWKNLIVSKASELSAGVEGSKPELVTLNRDAFNSEWKQMFPKMEPAK